LKDVGRRTADLVDTYEEDLPGVSVAVESRRLYPTADLTSHVLGYVGAINEDQLEKVPTRQLYSARIVGQAGIELMQNDALIGQDGGKQVEVNHIGRELRELSKSVNPIPGDDLYLSLDMRLQREIRTIMGDKSGVVIVMKPRTGEVLGMMSLPDYDPNAFVGGIPQQLWAELTQGPTKPLVNKALQGVYPPGSTFKMMMALAALDAGLIDENTVFHCPGYYKIGKDIRYCWKHSGHGDITVKEAIEKSCDVFFYNVGLLLGVDRIHDYGVQFGFTQATGVELENEKTGLLPSKEWKQKNFKEKWYDGETLPVSIGQGFVSVTPIQLLNYVNIIANRGLWVKPTVINHITTADGKDVVSDQTLPRHSRLLPISPKYFDIVREAMTWVVNRAGTGGRARSQLFEVAGKTGTSEVISRKTGHLENREASDENLPHSLFVGFAPAQDPRVSILVLVEHGQHGGETAAPIARQVLEFYSKHVEALDTTPPNNRPLGPADQFQKDLNTAFPDADPTPR
jgi:penicillin-binding protein 2